MLGRQAQLQVDLAMRIEALRDVVDRSVALSLLRRATGRPLALVDRRPFPPDLTAEEVAYRIRLPGDVVRLPVIAVVSGSAGSRSDDVTAAVGSPAQAVPEVPAALEAPAPLDLARPRHPAIEVRRRLIRDAGVALTGLTSVAMLLVAVWPSPSGGVLPTTATPGPLSAVVLGGSDRTTPRPVATVAVAEPSVKLAEPLPSPSTGAAPTPNPGRSAPGDSSGAVRPAVPPARDDEPAPRPSAPAVVGPAPSATPVRSPSPVPSPSPTEGVPSVVPPLPAATPDATPDPTPAPTPDPTPLPTPDPTPMPTPDPTPMPTPDPTPDPTPEATPDPTPVP